MRQTANTLITRPKIIVLDVYETLLDMREMERKVNGLLDYRRGYILWFELFMQYCFVDNCTVQFNDFISIAKATMQMTAYKLDRNVEESAIDSVLEMLKHLPVQNGVQEGLSVLANENFRIAALTNVPEAIVRERMERTGLISYFECVLSAEQVKKYKPSIEVYRWVAKQMNEKEKDMLFASSHGWDIAGAANAGMETAFIQQAEELLYPLAPTPCLVCNSLHDLANQLKAVQQ